MQKTNHYLTFKLGDELFAIAVDQVREVLELSVITRVPMTPDYVRGVVNVRGKAMPVVDLRRRFGLPVAHDTLSTRIIVMELQFHGESTVLAGVADSVHEVIELDGSAIDAPSAIALRWRPEFMRGLARHGDDFIIILAVDAAFASTELIRVEESPNEQPEVQIVD
jgi:purine-binding chemotaxis protein CheW